VSGVTYRRCHSYPAAFAASALASLQNADGFPAAFAASALASLQNADAASARAPLHNADAASALALLQNADAASALALLQHADGYPRHSPHPLWPCYSTQTVSPAPARERVALEPAILTR